MELHEALQQVSDIRAAMARSEVFRGYRSLTVGCSGLLGVIAACFQPYWVSSPAEQLGRYLVWWIGVASISVAVVAVELVWRAWNSGPGIARQRTRLAIEQFTPCLFVGATLTLAIYSFAPQAGWLLPGLWAWVFALGVFASHRLLPRAVFWVGVYYSLCGCAALRWGQDQDAFSPLQMGITFGGGQLITALILYWNLERNNAA